MSSPAGIAGIVVSVVIGTPLVATVIFFTSYFVYKYIRKHPSLLSNLSQGRKPPARNRIKDEPSILPTKKPSPGLDFDNAAFLNAMSNTSRELDPDQQSQSPTQHTILSYLSRDYTADDTLRTQVSGLVEQETRHNDQVILVVYVHVKSFEICMLLHYHGLHKAVKSYVILTSHVGGPVA